MKVTRVWFNKFESGKLLGFATVQFALTASGDGCMQIKDFKVWKRDGGGVDVSFPSTQDKKDPKKYYDTVRLDVENPDAVKLLEEIKSEVAKAVSRGDSKDQSETKGQSQGRKQPEVSDDDLL